MPNDTRTKLARKTAIASGPIHFTRPGARAAHRVGPRTVQIRIAGPMAKASAGVGRPVRNSTMKAAWASDRQIAKTANCSVVRALPVCSADPGIDAIGPAMRFPEMRFCKTADI